MEHMRGKHFKTDEEVMQASRKWLLSQSREFYATGIQKLIGRWQTCVDKEGGCVKTIRSINLLELRLQVKSHYLLTDPRRTSI